MLASCYRIVGYFLAASKPGTPLIIDAFAGEALLACYVAVEGGKLTWAESTA
jgi:hypothetical protein